MAAPRPFRFGVSTRGSPSRDVWRGLAQQTEDPFSFSGTYYKVSQRSLLPKPVQRPGPPILIGGGSRRILAIAGRYANIVGLNHRATPAGDIDASDITAEATAQKVEWVREAAGERFGISYIVVRDTDEGSPFSPMKSFAPIVARLAGT